MQPQQADSLVLALRNAAREMVDRRSISDLEYVLTQIVAVAVDTVPGVDAGGITMTENGHITSRSPTNDDIRKLDDLQAELHEGPCITAVEYPLRPAGGRARLQIAAVHPVVHQRGYPRCAQPLLARGEHVRRARAHHGRPVRAAGRAVALRRQPRPAARPGVGEP